MKRMLITCALAGLAFIANAEPSNGIQQTDWEFQLFGGPLYIPCVGESVTGTVHVTTRSHSFDTPSGNFHLVESYYGTVSMYSVDSDNTWIGHFAIPQNHNITMELRTPRKTDDGKAPHRIYGNKLRVGGSYCGVNDLCVWQLFLQFFDKRVNKPIM